MLITIYFRESPTAGLHGAPGRRRDRAPPVPGRGRARRAPVPRRLRLLRRPRRAPRRRTSGCGARTPAHAAPGDPERDRAARRREPKAAPRPELPGRASFPDDFRPVAAAITAYPPTQFEQQVSISAGARRRHRASTIAVVNGDGLVGRIVGVTRHTAQVPAPDRPGERGLRGRHRRRLDGDRASSSAGRAGSGALLFDRVEKRARRRSATRSSRGDRSEGELESLYPRGIPIGVVTFVGQTDTDLYKRIQLEPFVDFDALDRTVIVLSRRAAGDSARRRGQGRAHRSSSPRSCRPRS